MDVVCSQLLEIDMCADNARILIFVKLVYEPNHTIIFTLLKKQRIYVENIYKILFFQKKVLQKKL